jgi:hypothetical protein
MYDNPNWFSSLVPFPWWPWPVEDFYIHSCTVNISTTFKFSVSFPCSIPPVRDSTWSEAAIQLVPVASFCLTESFQCWRWQCYCLTDWNGQRDIMGFVGCGLEKGGCLAEMPPFSSFLFSPFCCLDRGSDVKSCSSTTGVRGASIRGNKWQKWLRECKKKKNNRWQK